VQDVDDYLAPRGVGHHYKASFHSSGQCNVSLSSDIRKSLVDDPLWEGKSRILSCWQVAPSPSADELRVLVELLFPGSYLDAAKPKQLGKSVDLLPAL